MLNVHNKVQICCIFLLYVKVLKYLNYVNKYFYAKRCHVQNHLILINTYKLKTHVNTTSQSCLHLCFGCI